MNAPIKMPRVVISRSNREMRLDTHFDPASSDISGAVERQRREMAWSKKIAEVLQRYYPGYVWAVRVQIDSLNYGAAVSLPALMPPARWYSIPLRMVKCANDLDRVVKEAGGHILERYRIPRSGIKIDRFLEAEAPRLIQSRTSAMPE